LRKHDGFFFVAKKRVFRAFFQTIKDLSFCAPPKPHGTSLMALMSLMSLGSRWPGMAHQRRRPWVITTKGLVAWCWPASAGQPNKRGGN
jgi:hypothetical protein